MKAKCGGGAAAWVSGVLTAPGTQGSLRLGQQEISALEGYGNQYWPICSSILAWRAPLTKKTGRPQSAAAAAAKSLQSCPTLCDPIDVSPPGSPIPGILQAGILEWVAISFSNA